MVMFFFMLKIYKSLLDTAMLFMHSPPFFTSGVYCVDWRILFDLSSMIWCLSAYRTSSVSEVSKLI